MLTKDDLNSISELINGKFKTELSPIYNKLNTIQSELHTDIQRELKPVKSQLRQIQKTLKTSFNFLDNEIISHEKRIVKLETFNIAKTD